MASKHGDYVYRWNKDWRGMKIIVTGLPRSGTTLMMKMLYKGGVEVVADTRVAFEDIRPTYLPEDSSFLDECDNKAIKVLDPLRCRLPYGPHYKFILMKRDPKEVARSQAKFLYGNRNAKTNKSAREIKKAWYDTLLLLNRYPDSEVLVVRFEDLLMTPASESDRIRTFLGVPMDIYKMSECVLKRGPECLPQLAEFGFKDESG